MIGLQRKLDANRIIIRPLTYCVFERLIKVKSLEFAVENLVGCTQHTLAQRTVYNGSIGEELDGF